MLYWRYLSDSGKDLGASKEFADVAAAEAWLGQEWSDLRDGGIDEVELVDNDGNEVLYRMKLSEADA